MRGAARSIVKRGTLARRAGMVWVSFDCSAAKPWGRQPSGRRSPHQLWHEEYPDVHDHNHRKIEPLTSTTDLAERRVRP